MILECDSRDRIFGHTPISSADDNILNVNFESTEKMSKTLPLKYLEERSSAFATFFPCYREHMGLTTFEAYSVFNDYILYSHAFANRNILLPTS